MSTVKDEVASIFERLKTGELSPTETSPQSGWEISLPSGRTVTRSTLQAEARPIIALGLDAVPELLPRVMNEHPALRYVAIYALEQITGEKPHIPYFADTDEEGYRVKAIDIWRNWYTTRTEGQSTENAPPRLPHADN
jgi:hypothetical protein